MEAPRRLDEPRRAHQRAVLFRGDPLQRLGLLGPEDRDSTLAEVLGRPEDPVAVEPLGAGGITALEERRVERQRPAGAQDLADLAQDLALVLDEVDRIAEHHDVDLRDQAAEIFRAALDEFHEPGSDPAAGELEFGQRRIDRVDQPPAALHQSLEEELGDGARPARQIHEPVPQRGDALNQPAVHLSEEGMARKSGKPVALVIRGGGCGLGQVLAVYDAILHDVTSEPTPVEDITQNITTSRQASDVPGTLLARRGRPGLPHGDGNVNRIPQIPSDHSPHRVADRGREQRGLPRRRRPHQDLLHV